MIDIEKQVHLTSELEHSTIAKAAMIWILNGEAAADIFIEETVKNEHTQYQRYEFYEKESKFCAGHIDFHPGIYLAFRYSTGEDKVF